MTRKGCRQSGCPAQSLRPTPSTAWTRHGGAYLKSRTCEMEAGWSQVQGYFLLHRVQNQPGIKNPGVLACTCNSNTLEAEAGGFLLEHHELYKKTLSWQQRQQLRQGQEQEQEEQQQQQKSSGRTETRSEASRPSPECPSLSSALQSGPASPKAPRRSRGNRAVVLLSPGKPWQSWVMWRNDLWTESSFSDLLAAAAVSA